MEARDTVIEDRAWKEMYVKGILCGKRWGHVNIREDLEAQAEISFKLGVREVVGWMDDTFPDWRRYAQARMSKDNWQAKLKEWGIK